MYLQLNQRNDLIFALGKDFDPDSLESMLFHRLNRRLYDVLIPKGTTYPKVVEAVVDTAEQEGWTWNLIEGALAFRPGGPHLNQFIAKHPDFDPAQGPPPVVDYVMAHILRAGRFFINRKHLRKALTVMKTGDGPRVLVVTGDRLSGKTYTRELITYFTEKTPKNRAIYVDLDRLVYEAPTLTQEVGQLLGMDVSNIPQQEDEQNARWVKRLCGWIIARIVNPGDVTYWFIFDGFREQTLLPETRDWIEELVLQSETNLQNCRVVLLNYNEVLPLQINDYVCREKIEPIRPDDVVAFLEQLNIDHKKNYGKPELQSKVAVIMAQVDQAIGAKPENQMERIPLLTKAVSATAKLLFA